MEPKNQLHRVTGSTVVVLTCLLLLLQTVAVVHAEITTAPENTAARIGTSTFLNCTAVIPSGDYVTWNYRPPNNVNPGGVRIYNSRDGVDSTLRTLFGCEVNNASGSHNLIINSVSTELGVEYWCSFALASNIEASAYVIAVNQLTCPTSGRTFPQGHVLSESCSVEYKGDIPPTLTWKYENDTALENQAMVVQDGTRVTATLNITLDPRYDMLDLFCHLSFVSGTGKQSSIRPAAANIPSYTDVCTIYYGVIHPVSTMSILPKPDDSGFLGDLVPDNTINCTANGNPEPTYTWKRSDGSGGEVNGMTLTITSDMVDLPQPLHYMCVASNSIDNGATTSTVAANVTFNVKPSKEEIVSGGGVEAWVIAVAVVVPIVVIAVAVIVGILCYRHRMSKKSTDKPKGTNSSSPFINPTATGAPPAAVNRYPPNTTSTNTSAFGHYTAATRPAPMGNGQATPGYGDLAGQSLGGSQGRLGGSQGRLGGSNGRLNQPVPFTARPPQGPPSSGTSTPSTTQVNPGVISMRPNPVNPMAHGPDPIYRQVARDPPRPPSVISSSSRSTSHAPSINGGRLNLSSAHGSIV
jgi:hypothetical protein